MNALVRPTVDDAFGRAVAAFPELANGTVIEPAAAVPAKLQFDSLSFRARLLPSPIVGIDAGLLEALIDANWRDESRRAAISGVVYVNLIVKQLISMAGRPVLVARDGPLLARAAVLGPLRFVQRVRPQQMLAQR